MKHQTIMQPNINVVLARNLPYYWTKTTQRRTFSIKKRENKDRKGNLYFMHLLITEFVGRTLIYDKKGKKQDT